MTAAAKTLLVRADAGRTIGNGHVQRCFSLMQSWKSLGGNVALLSHELPLALQRRITAMGGAVHALQAIAGSLEDARITASLCTKLAADWIVVDGYAFEDRYIQRLKQGSTRVLCVLDDHRTCSADVILNQNLYADVACYESSQSQLLLGGRYVQLRDEFLQEVNWQKPATQRLQRILVTCGGTDPAAATGSILKQLAETHVADLEVIAVVSSENSKLSDLQSLCEQLPYSAKLAIDSTQMAKLMQWADLAISAAGSTCWELAFMGLPVLMFSVAENQIPVAKVMEEQGLGIDLGWYKQMAENAIVSNVHALCEEPQLLQEMSVRGWHLIDGYGANRVARLLFDPRIQLRPATSADCRMFWEWRNDPSVREVSFSSDEIPFDTHAAWFARRLASPASLLLVAENTDQQPFGQVRFDFTRDIAEISISIAREFRKAGYGTALIRQATEYILGRQRATVVKAAIKTENIASQKAFEKAGYQQVDSPGDSLLFATGHFATGLDFQPFESSNSIQRTA